MHKTLFLYRFDFPPYKNPRDRKDEFEENLKFYLKSNILNYGMSALGGMRLTMGHVHRDNGDVSEDDRKALASWATTQPIKCTAHFGEIEIDHPDLQFFREIDDWVFPIDNLSEQDRVDATSYEQKIDEMLQAALKRQSGQAKNQGN